MTDDNIQRRNHFELWVQLFTAVALALCLFMVWVELQQTRQANLTELEQLRVEATIQERSIIFGEDLALVLETACFEPAQLSRVERLILHNFFEVQVLQMFRIYLLNTLGDYNDTPWERLARHHAQRLLSFPPGRTWLTTHPYYSDGIGPLKEYLKNFKRDEAYSCENVLRWTASKLSS